jgi:hypothetical protein
MRRAFSMKARAVVVEGLFPDLKSAEASGKRSGKPFKTVKVAGRTFEVTLQDVDGTKIYTSYRPGKNAIEAQIWSDGLPERFQINGAGYHYATLENALRALVRDRS